LDLRMGFSKKIRVGNEAPERRDLWVNRLTTGVPGKVEKSPFKRAVKKC